MQNNPCIIQKHPPSTLPRLSILGLFLPSSLILLIPSFVLPKVKDYVTSCEPRVLSFLFFLSTSRVSFFIHAPFDLLSLIWSAGFTSPGASRLCLLAATVQHCVKPLFFPSCFFFLFFSFLFSFLFFSPFPFLFF